VSKWLAAAAVTAIAAPPDAYDCSGLVYAAYAAAGIRIARTTHQWRQDGPQIPLPAIQPGDLLFSAGSDGTAANPGHVVMYLGGGQVIQAPRTGEDVQVDPLDLAGVVTATPPPTFPTTPDPPRESDLPTYWLLSGRPWHAFL
jgi:cell wall-associated NlpC family hydrolase